MNNRIKTLKFLLILACLVTLLSLGIKNIRLEPTLPTFVSPNVLKVLIDNIKLITTPEQDLHDILGGAEPEFLNSSRILTPKLIYYIRQTETPDVCCESDL